MRPRSFGGIILLALLAPLAWLAGNGCSYITETTASTSTDTLGQPTVEIDPAQFLDPSGVVCADLPGAMHSYVATFFDLGPEIDGGYAPGYPVQLPSTPPTPCSQRVSYTNGVNGHRYVVAIDGYEQPASQLLGACSSQPSYAYCPGEANAPKENGICTSASDCFARGCWGQCLDLPRQHLEQNVDGTSSCHVIEDGGTPEHVNVCHYTPVLGDRHMVAVGTYAPVTPRWTTPDNQPCGYQTAAIGTGYVVTEITGCGLLKDNQNGTGTTAIDLNPTAAMGTYACAGGTGKGTVSKLAVKPGDITLPEQDFGCPPAKAAHWEQGVVAGRDYVFTVNGFENGAATATLTAKCFATTIAGVTVQAKCDPLLPIQ